MKKTLQISRQRPSTSMAILKFLVLVSQIQLLAVDKGEVQRENLAKATLLFDIDSCGRRQDGKYKLHIHKIPID
jgi:hypothetical protein